MTGPGAAETPWWGPFGTQDGAQISVCQRYRYLLWRGTDGTWAPLVFIMLNPSTADATKDDPTIRRCLGFARRENAGGIVVANLSPWRATAPRELDMAWRNEQDVLSRPWNEQAINFVARRGKLVMAWGSGIRPWMVPLAVRFRAGEWGPAFCLGLTSKGEPRHPLMVRASQALVFP